MEILASWGRWYCGKKNRHVERGSMKKKSNNQLAIALIRILSLCALWLIAANLAWAQLGTATMSGNVTDPSGGVVVGATVSVTNNATGFVRQTVTNAQGQYNIPGLVPGSYSVRVEFS